MKMISYRLEPNVAIVLDVTHSTDSPGIDRNKHGTIKLGSGPTVTHGTANHPEVVKRLITLANELGIPIQHEASSRATGTDTDHVYAMKGRRPKRSALRAAALHAFTGRNDRSRRRGTMHRTADSFCPFDRQQGRIHPQAGVKSGVSSCRMQSRLFDRCFHSSSALAIKTS